MLANIWAWIVSLFGGSPALPPGWNILYSPNMPPQMSSDPADGSFHFDFPAMDGVHYVLKNSPPVSLGQTITVKFAIVGDGKLIPVDGDTTARVRIMLEQRGDDLATP